MKRVTLFIGAVVIVIGAWSFAWWTGREAVRTALAEEAARLAAVGIEASYNVAWIDGYPFSHRLLLRDVVLSNPTIGTLTLPTVMVGRAFPTSDRIELDLPDSAVLSPAPKPDEAAETTEETAEESADTATEAPAPAPASPPLSIELADATVDLIKVTDEQGLVTASLPSVTFSVEPEDHTGSGGKLRLTDAAVTLVLPRGVAATFGQVQAPGQGQAPVQGQAPGQVQATGQAEAPGQVLAPERRFVLEAARVEVAAGSGGPGLTAGTINLDGKQISVTARWEGTDPLTGGLDATLLTGGVALEAEGGSLGGQAALSFGTMGGTYGIEDGLGTIRSTFEETTLLHTPAGEPDAVRGVSIDRIDFAQSDPVTSVTVPKTLELRLSAGEIVPDEAGWNWLDAADQLPRETAQIHLSVNARAVPSNLADPYLPLGGRIAGLALDIDMRGLGAAAAGTVDLQIDPDGDTRGGGQILLDGTMGLVRDLIAAEVLDIRTAQTVLDMAARYARPGALPEDLILDITSEDGQLTIGGEPVTLFQPLLPAGE